LIQPKLHKDPIVSGTLYKDDDLVIDRSLIEGIPFCARNDPELFMDDSASPRKRYDFDTPENVPDYGGDEEVSDTPDTSQQRPAQVALDAIALASRMQTDLETVAMDFVQHFKDETKESNLCLVGGVALNSVLNGRLSRELNFEKTFIPPYPGDDGIAVGCCAYGLNRKAKDSDTSTSPTTVWKEPLTPYLGGVPSDLEIKMGKNH